MMFKNPSFKEIHDLELFRVIYIYRNHNPAELKYIVMNLGLYRVKFSNSGYLQYVIFCCIRFKSESN